MELEIKQQSCSMISVPMSGELQELERGQVLRPYPAQ